MQTLKAIVLKTQNYKETSKLVYIYTEVGKVSLIAKGAHRNNSKVRSILEPLTEISCVVGKGELKTLISADLLENNTSIKYNFEKQVYALHILEIIYRLAIDVDHSKIYLLLHKAISKINEGMNPELVSFIFELKFLHFLGYGLDFNNYTFYTNQIEKIKELYYIRYDDITNDSLTKQESNLIRKEIDIIYQDLLSFKTNSRSLLNDLYHYTY